MLAGLVGSGCDARSARSHAAVHLDPRVRALPADTDWIAGADVPALLTDPVLADRVRGDDVLGLPGGLHAIDHVVVGCGPSGCVALLDGDVDRASFGSIEGPSEHLTTRAGWRGRLDRLGDGKLVLGDRALVRSLRTAHREHTATFDPGWLDEQVPAGALWFATRDVHALSERAPAWLAALGFDPLIATAESLRALDVDRFGIQTAAAAFEPGDRAVVVRLTSSQALGLEAVLRGRALRGFRGLTDVQIERHGSVVELQATLTAESP